MNAAQVREAIDPLLAAWRGAGKVPDERRHLRPDWGITFSHKQTRECWVGYRWSRLYSHHLTGRVYECKVAFGVTFEAALQQWAEKLKQQQQ